MKDHNFRALTMNGLFVYGGLITLADNYNEHVKGSYIFIEGQLPFENLINPSTIGQFTGFFDKKKTAIYEGDIVRVEIHHPNEFRYDILICVVEQHRGCWILSDYKGNEFLLNRHIQDVNCVGDIHRDPELMK